MSRIRDCVSEKEENLERKRRQRPGGLRQTPVAINDGKRTTRIDRKKGGAPDEKMILGKRPEEGKRESTKIRAS